MKAIGLSSPKATQVLMTFEISANARVYRAALFAYHLGTPFHFRVSSLDAVEIELSGGVRARAGRSSTSTQANQHRRTSQHDDVGTITDIVGLLDGMLGPNCTNAAGDHDGLVITSPVRGLIRPGRVGEQGSKHACESGTSELVVELCRADGCLAEITGVNDC